MPQDSPVKEFTDLRGKRIGVISMASAGVLVARELARVAGLDPDTDVNIVVAGEGAQTAAMVRGGQVDALSQFDTQYAMVENAGVRLRLLDTRAIDRFPSNGFLALEETLRSRRKEAVALARSYAKGTVLRSPTPRPPSGSSGRSSRRRSPPGRTRRRRSATTPRCSQARAQNWRLEKGGRQAVGRELRAELRRLRRLHAEDRHHQAGGGRCRSWITNELIDEINRFDPEKIATEARAFRAGG